MFWDNYKLVELGTLVSLEEFLSNKDLIQKVKLGVKGLYSDVMTVVEKCVGKRDEDAIWELIKRKIIDGNLTQEYLDVINLVKEIDNIDNVILYTMLVRIMEDLEQLYVNVSTKC